MMKLPLALTGGTAPSGSSVACTYPVVSGSRTGGPCAGFAGCGFWASKAVAAARPITIVRLVRVICPLLQPSDGRACWREYTAAHPERNRSVPTSGSAQHDPTVPAGAEESGSENGG